MSRRSPASCFLSLLARRAPRRPLLPLRDSSSSLASRRWGQTSTTTTARPPPHHRRSTWTTGRTLLFAAFASSLTYVYGVMDTGSHLDALWKKAKPPHYGSQRDLNQVRPSLTWSRAFSDRLLFRPSQRSAMLWERTPSVPMTRIYGLMDTRNGPPSIRIRCLLLWHIHDLPRRFPR